MVGSNTLTVTVTAEDNSTRKTYTITVTRAAAPPDPTDYPTDTDWCTTMGVGYFSGSSGQNLFETFGYLADSNLGDLGSTTFSHGGTPYSVSGVSRFKNSSLNGNTVISDSLALTVSRTLPDGTVLQLGSRTFTVGTDSLTNTTGREQWDIVANPLSLTAGQHVTVSLKFPDPAVTVSETALTVAEQNTTGDNYTVVLDSLPTAGVVITVAGHSNTDVTPTPTTLTFTTSDWETAQTVTVTAGDDSDTLTDTVTLTHSAESTDSNYDGITIANVTVTVNDNDSATTTPGAPTGLRAAASGQTQINLSWNAPGSDGGSSITGYKIEVSSNGNSGWTNLVANTGNSNRTYSHTGLSAGATRYYRVSAINSNDTGPASNVANATTRQTTVSFGAVNYTATEGGSNATVAVNLSQAPSASVTIPLTTQHLGTATSADYSGVPSSVTFTSGQTRRTFTVRATNDSVDDDGESVRLGFGTLPSGVALGSRATMTVALDDDDGARQVVVKFDKNIHDAIQMTEGKARSRIMMSLDQTPLRTVTIPLVVTHRGGATAADYSGFPASVTFGANETKADFFPRAILDEEREIGEGLRLDFGPMPPGVSKRSWGAYATVEFEDDLPESKVWFGAESYTAT